MVTKVADFGLSRDIYISDYYKLDRSVLLPVKWLAPEALFDKSFSAKTDVVSGTILLHYSCHSLVITLTMYSNSNSVVHVTIINSLSISIKILSLPI